MSRVAKFGLTKPMHRSSSGDLLGCELEEIYDFLKRDGILIAEYSDYIIVIPNPNRVESVRQPLLDAGLQPVMLGATLQNVRVATDLNLAENRVMELLSPGSLLLVRDHDALSLLIPENRDLRDIATIFQGTMIAYCRRMVEEHAKIEETLQIIGNKLGNYMIGVLESYHPNVKKEMITVVKIRSISNIECVSEGSISISTVREAADRVSIWEVEDWT